MNNTTATQSESPIPVGVFGAVPRQKPSQQNSHYPHQVAVERTVLRSIMYLGVSRYQLGRLLGLGNVDLMRQWLNGTRRPSSLFLTRLNWMTLLRTEGFEWVRVQSIDWDTGEITYRGENHIGRRVRYDANGYKIVFLDQEPVAL